jgi:spermidine/putrescine transport system permease protein
VAAALVLVMLVTVTAYMRLMRRWSGAREDVAMM